MASAGLAAISGLVEHADRTMPSTLRGTYQDPSDYLDEMVISVSDFDAVRVVTADLTGSPATLDDSAGAVVTVAIDAGESAASVLEDVLAWINDYRPGQKMEIEITVNSGDEEAEGLWPSPDPAFLN